MLPEDSLKKKMSTLAAVGKDIIDDKTWSEKAVTHRFRLCTTHSPAAKFHFLRRTH